MSTKWIRTIIPITFTVLLVVGCSAPQKPSETVEPVVTIEPYEILAEEEGMKDPYGIAINTEGHIFVMDAGNHRVLILDENGEALGAWDQQGSEPGAFKTMGFGGIAVDGQDNVFVVDNGNHRIQKFDEKGNFILSWGSEGKAEGQFVRAIGIATDQEGNVYVTDDGNPYVQKFDNNGTFLMRFGGFQHATGIAVAMDGSIYVSDYETKWVQKFDKNGTLELSWQLTMNNAKPGTPEGIAIDEEGNVYVTDYDLGQVHVFDKSGQFQWTLGEQTDAEVRLSRPTAIALKNGKIHIVNQGSNKISVFPKPE